MKHTNEHQTTYKLRRKPDNYQNLHKTVNSKVEIYIIKLPKNQINQMYMS